MFSDRLETDFTIDGVQWEVIDAKVVHSQTEKPNYAEVKAVVAEDVPDGEIPETITNLRGSTSSLSIETELSEKRKEIAEEAGNEFEVDPLLFSGRVARIYPNGDKSVDVVLFDPGQSLFEQSSGSSSDSSDKTSVQNTIINLAESQFSSFESRRTETVTEIRALDAVQYITDELGITDRDLTGLRREVGTEYTVDGETRLGGKNILLKFKNPKATASEILEQIANETESTYWFDKEGTFNFGPPDIKTFDVRYITDTTAGITTPPYQSVEVIGTGVASEGGFTATNVIPEENIIKRIAIKSFDQSEGGYELEQNALKAPVYRYKSADLVTDAQVASTAQKLIEKIGEQQKTGEITMVGFPELTLDDIIRVPDSDQQPMGGEDYAVTKITHRINSSDGFTTKVKVSAPFVGTKVQTPSPEYGQFKPTTLLEKREVDGEEVSRGGTPLGLQNADRIAEETKDDAEESGFLDGILEGLQDLGELGSGPQGPRQASQDEDDE